ncbi:MAG: SDR family oxidoreductase [Deltaproteobacteria bacterium]|jgi:NAD(P)-dependent dehydrogenase (short-subunit alcohol dehydrogenase family)|nr:SDR family oxidoreductase [Deltaproteobacteria bacterium]
MAISKDIFSIQGRVAVITGGGGLMGRRHAEAVLEAGGIPVLLDVSSEALRDVAVVLHETYKEATIVSYRCDITDQAQVDAIRKEVMSDLRRIDILINNAANNPKIEIAGGLDFSRLENFPLETWQRDINVGLTGALICTRIFADAMKETGGGVIVNIASDLAMIAPDQRIYRREGLADERQPVKPVSYSVIKAGLIGLTRYSATYYVNDNIRCNALVPGGIYAGQDEGFVRRLTNLIPMGRMACPDEYKGAIIFLVSDASSYMTGSCLVVDGGRTCW